MTTGSNANKFPHFSEHKTGKNRHFLEALHYARVGIVYAFRSERNLRIEGVIFILALVMAGVVGLTRLEWVALILCAMAVFAAEFTNTLIEWVCDLYVGEHYHPLVKHIKDAAAGLVTLITLGAVLVGLLLFVPHLWAWVAPLLMHLSQ
ncbi:MAG: diacylglycerol kinase family protein [Aerococcus sp.]|nr:diacylglycerol kinase family protein [Aerococcus sp.]